MIPYSREIFLIKFVIAG